MNLLQIYETCLSKEKIPQNVRDDSRSIHEGNKALCYMKQQIPTEHPCQIDDLEPLLHSHVRAQLPGTIKTTTINTC